MKTVFVPWFNRSRTAPWAICTGKQKPELARDERFASYASRLENVDELYAEIAACIATRSSAEWLSALDEAQIPCVPVNGPDDLPDDPHLAAVDFWEFHEDAEFGTLRLPGIPSRFSETPGSIRRLAPRLGEHSAKILAEAGLSTEQIQSLIASGATVQAPPLEDMDRKEKSA